MTITLPADASASAVAPARPASWSQIATAAPEASKRSTMARPMPCAPPVTTAARPLRSMLLGTSPPKICRAIRRGIEHATRDVILTSAGEIQPPLEMAAIPSKRWSLPIGEGPMDGAVLGLFLTATFVGGLTTGLAGFAMGLVVSGIWLHILTPIQTASLIVAYGLLVQGYGTWKLRHAFDWRRVASFIAGGAVGVPIGGMLLAHMNPTHLRDGVGLLLVLYSTYGLARPTL